MSAAAVAVAPVGLWAFAVVGFVAPMVVGRFIRPKIADDPTSERTDPD